VLYPGLKSFPQAELAQKLHSNGLHGGIVTFELHGGTDAALAFIKNASLCSLAESLGACETMLTHSATMTHADVPRAQREAAGISDGLVRLSVGLEDVEDIIADLDAALDAA
jgi:cystathionine gamma-lyase